MKKYLKVVVMLLVAAFVSVCVGAAPAELDTAESAEETFDQSCSYEDSLLLDVVASGSCGSRLTWTLDSDGTLTVQGSGKMNDWSYAKNTPWYSKRSRIKHVEICEGVTVIGKNAFARTSVESVSMADSVTAINDFAFESSSLVSFKLGKGVKTIGDSVFNNCQHIQEFQLNEVVTDIGSGNFINFNMECKVDSIVFPKTLKTLGSGCFTNAQAVEAVTFYNKDTQIGKDQFYSTDVGLKVYGFKYSTAATLAAREGKEFVPLGEMVLVSGDDSVVVGETISLTATYFNELGVYSETGFTFDVANPSAVTYEVSDNEIKLTGVESGQMVTVIATHNESGVQGTKEIMVGGFNFNISEEMPYYTYVGYNLLSRVQDIPASNESFEGMGIYVSDEYDASDLNIYSSNNDVFVVTGYHQDGDFVKISVMGKDKGEAKIVADCPDGTTVTRTVIVDYVNEIEFEATYDTFYRYSNGVMFGSNDKMSITVPILIRMKNKVNEFFYNAGSEFSDFLTIDDLEIEATIDSPNLSFTQDSYSNKSVIKLTEEMSLEPEKTLADLVLLFPYNVGEDTFKSLSHYTLTFNFKSEKIKETSVDIVVSVIKRDSVLAYEHIEFINNNSYYYALKAEDPAESMIELKSDPRYAWTSITSTISGEALTFDNPYEIMMADVILTYTTTPDKAQSSLGEICSQFKASYDYFVDALDLYLNDSYAGVVRITEPDIIKVMEAAKNNYNSAEFIDRYKLSKIDELVHSVNGKTKVKNILKLGGVAAEILEYASMGSDVYNDVMNCLNVASALKAYNYLDEHSRSVFREIASGIDDNNKLRDAMMRYVNSEADSEAYRKEMMKACDTMMGKSAIEVFNVTLGVYARETVWNYLGGIIVKKAGEAAVLSATKTGEVLYSSLPSVAGGVAAGVMLGLEVSDILCNNTEYAEDCRRIIVCAEFSPHIKKALEKYETRLMLDLTAESIAGFEAAFELYKALQYQSAEYTKEALEHSWDSLVAKIFNKKGDYISVYNDIGYRQSRIEGLICHTNSKVGNISTTLRKTLMFKCPVDVYLYDEDGELVASIVNEVPKSYDVSVAATVIQNAKYFHVPSGVDYKVVVEAREDGKMNCSFAEGDSEQETSRVNYNNVALLSGQQFVVDVSGDTDNAYTMSLDGDVIVPDDIFGDGEIQEVTVNVTTDGEGRVVAPETASKGEYVIVMAIPDEGKSFLGWYDGTTLVSSSEKYGFIVDSDINLTAKFGDYTPADINGDGSVTNRDASRLMQHLAGWDVDVVEAALDVTGDGIVNNRDASRILQYVAGWDVELH